MATRTDKMTKKNLIFKEKFTIESVDCNNYWLIKLSDTSHEFRKFYWSGNKLYCKGVNGCVYQFQKDRVDPIDAVDKDGFHSPLLLDNSRSLCMLKGDKLIEFSSHKTVNHYNVSIRRSTFAPDGVMTDTDHEIIDFEYAYPPHVLYVNGYILISNKYRFDTPAYCDRSKYPGWVYNGVQDDNGVHVNYPDVHDAIAIIYNSVDGTRNNYDGMFDFTTIGSRFVITFNKEYFAIVDIATGKFKMKIDSEIGNYFSQIYVKNVLAPFENAVQVLSYKGYADCTATQYDLLEDKNYVPKSNECIMCYKDIDLDIVLVPCGHRRYCESCASTRKFCNLKCECKGCDTRIKSYVKINDQPQKN